MSLLSELRRRNVIRMAALYLVVAWLIVQVAGTVLPMFGVPAWVARAIVILLALGFVPAVVFAWLYSDPPFFDPPFPRRTDGETGIDEGVRAGAREHRPHSSGRRAARRREGAMSFVAGLRRRNGLGRYRRHPGALNPPPSPFLRFRNAVGCAQWRQARGARRTWRCDHPASIDESPYGLYSSRHEDVK
jgi:hypothetical protein